MTSTTTEAQQALEATPTAELLTKAYALTHQIHESEVRERYSEDVQRTRDLRAMRDLITAEVLRRTGDPDQFVRGEVDAGRACGQHDRPLPCIECAG